MPQNLSKDKDECCVAELCSFLEALGKERFLETLTTAGITSVDQLACVEDLSSKVEALPRMVARLLRTRAVETQELRNVLHATKKTQYLAALLRGDICTLEAIVDRAEQLPVPRMVARLLQKRAAERMRARPLLELLRMVGKEQYLEALLQLDVHEPEQLRDCTVEKLSSAMPRMVARILIQKAKQHCAPDDPPHHRGALSEDTKTSIRAIHLAIRQATHESFGKRFYEIMLSMDSKAVPSFAGVSLSTLGHDFDDMLGTFIELLDDGDAFARHSDALVGRLVHYRVPMRSLWLAADAFAMAAVSLAPEVDLSMDVSCWVRFYRAIIPPLHPTILRATAITSQEEWDVQRRDFFPRMNDTLARRGYLYLTRCLHDRPRFVEDLCTVIETLREWQAGSGSWTTFAKASSNLLDGIESQEMKLVLLIELPLAVEDRVGEQISTKLGNVLMTAACALFGIDLVHSSTRGLQRERVWEQWSDIYRFTDYEFGEQFYVRFTREPRVAETFKTGVGNMQRERFVHQLNVLLIRINEDFNRVLRPILIELGARHRVSHSVGSHEMNLFAEPLLETVQEMLGRSYWRDEIADSWAFVVNIIQHYMMVGWTCGIGLLHESTEDIAERRTSSSSKIKFHRLKILRAESPEDFARFFERFASSLSDNICAGLASDSTASKRYQAGVDKILDETDMTVILDGIQALGRRHRLYHGLNKLDTLSAAATLWMSRASAVFGERFTVDIAVEWALLWELIAVSMLPDYKTNESCPLVEELVAPYRPKPVSKPATTTLTLKERISFPNDTVVLRFAASQPVEQKAGQFAKLRWNLEGKTISRFYSIASCPNPSTGRATELEFIIKEVPGGRLSPFLVRRCLPAATCEILTTAGSFVLEKSAKDTQRLMISAGVGIVAFMSVIRSVVARIKLSESIGHRRSLVRQDSERQHVLEQHKVVLSLIHSERTTSFPFFDELLEILREFGGTGHDWFRFYLTFCYTGTEKDKVAQLKADHPLLHVYTERVGQSILSTALQQFVAPSETPIYVCGPGAFQKATRETFLKKMGHSRSLMHLEFFDL